MTTLKDFLNSIGAEAYTPEQGCEGCIIVTNAPHSKRFRLSKEFAQDLGSPSAIYMYFAKDKLVIVAADAGSSKSFKFGSGGIIYNSNLAKKIMELSGAEFPEGKSVKVGSYEMNQLEDGTSYAEVTFNKEK